MATWKDAERRIAQLLGCVRNPVNGKGNEPDVSSSVLAVEVKHRAALPVWLGECMRQAERTAKGRLPLLVLHESGQRYDQAYVVLRLSTFAALTHGDGAQAGVELGPVGVVGGGDDCDNSQS